MFLLVTTVAPKDIKTFVRILPFIKNHIKPDSILVATPSSSLALLQTHCKHDPSISLYSDEDIIPPDELSQLKACFVNLAIQKSTGWYIQQIIKIYLAASSPDDALILIWDSDTVPLKSLSFKDENNILYYATSNEHHQPYFDLIFKSLKLNRLSSKSFIAQCLPMYGSWVKSFLAHVASMGYTSLSHAIVDSAYKCDSITVRFGFFSEYETLGNYFLANYSSLFRRRDLSWFRYGAIIYYFTRSIPVSCGILRLFFSYCSFEHLNKPLPYKLLASFYRYLIYHTCLNK